MIRIEDLELILRKCLRLIDAWESTSRDFPESLQQEKAKLLQLGRDLKNEASRLETLAGKHVTGKLSYGDERVTKERKLQLLKAFPGFQTLSNELLTDLAGLMYEKRPERNELVVKKGVLGTELYFIHRGSVAILNDSDASDPEPVSTLGQDQFFGELGLVLNVPRTASVRSNSPDTILLIVTAAQLNSVVANTVFEDGFRLALAEMEQWWKMMDYKVGKAADFGNEFFTDLARQRLQQLSIFRDAGANFLRELSREVELVVYPENHLIFKYGDDSRELYFIVKGCVEVSGPSDASCGGPAKIVSYGQLTEDMFFGELGILFDHKRSATTIAVKPTKLFVLKKDRVQQLLEKNEVIAKKIYAVANERRAKYGSTPSIHSDAQQPTAADIPAELPAVEPEQALQTSSMKCPLGSAGEMELKLQYVDKASIFEIAPTNVKEKAALFLQRHVVAPGTLILKYGDKSTFMFFLGQGQVDVLDQNGESLMQPKGPDAYFGEVGLLNDVTRTADIKAMTECVIYKLSSADFHVLLELWPQLAVEIDKKARDRFQHYLMRDILA